MSECLDVIRNEWIKLLRRKRFLVVLLLGLGIAAFFLAVEYKHAKQLSLYNSPDYQRQQLERWIQDTERALADDKKLAGAERQAMEESVQSMKKELEELEQHSGVPAPFDEEKAKSRVAGLKESLASLPPEHKNSRGSLEIELMKAEYLLDNRVAVNDKRFGEGMTMWRAMKDFMEIGPLLFIPMLCVLLVSDIISGEMTAGTVKLLLIRPVSRGRIYLGKFLTSITASVVVVTILLAVIAGFSYVLFGADGADNPEAVGVSYYKAQEMMEGRMTEVTVVDPSDAHIVSAGTYFLVSLLLTVLATVVMTGLGFFASVLVRSAAVSTGLAMSVVVMGLAIQGTARGMGFLKGLATTHFNLGRVWSGEVYQSFGVSTTLPESLLILLAWSAGMYLLGYVLFTRRDILA